MKRIIGIISILLLALQFGLMAQDVSLKVQAPEAVELGQRFQLTFSVNKRGSNFNLPNIENFDVLGGPSVGSSSSISIINGKRESSVKYTYTYVLAANKKGTFEIPSATITVDNKTIKSRSLKIKVVGNGNNANQQNNSGSEAKADFFIRTFVSKKEVYKGEPIVVSIKLFTKNEFNLSNFKEPGYNGFWKKEVEDINQNAKREAYNDKVYNTFLLKKSILFPQKSGELIIDEATVEAVVRTYTERNARNQTERMFYGNRIRVPSDKNIEIKSPQVKINVKDLPLNNRPANFSKVVGEDFSINAEINNSKIDVDDALNLKITLKGKGNIDLLDIGDINFPPDFEAYEPKINQRSNANDYGVIGEKSFEYLLIPRSEGVFNFPPIRFSYFDVVKKSYVELKTDSFTIIVGEGNSSKEPNFAASSQKEIHHLGNDIRFIKKDIGRIYKKDFHFFGSTIYKGIILGFSLIALLFVLFYNHLQKQKGNLSKIRNKKATKVALKRLKLAKKLMDKNQKTEFYLEISRALYGYLSDKLNLKNIDLSIDNVSEVIKSKGVRDELNLQLKQILNDSELARFAPDSSDINMQNIYNDSLNIIIEIEKEIKNK